ncbi:MAG: Gfo/Idh/MocA family oxidoreductase [Gammaproteobacteria bacterium]|nr:Gfo/Idh/MocA family oxidoreductase [Gammaproteobacteria bacterium]
MTEGMRQIRVGVIGLGRAFTLMLPTLVLDPRFQLVAAATPDPSERAKFAREFQGATYATASALCRDHDVDVVYVASPHRLHFEHVEAAVRNGKHVLVEKPLAIELEDGQSMIDAAAKAGVSLVVGPSHSFDAPVVRARAIIESGELGSLKTIMAANYTDFLYRPRSRDELDTRRGGGVIFNQAVHQIDVVRLLAGGMVSEVRAFTGSWDAERPTEGAYHAMLQFADGVFASLIYSGYGHFDSDEFMGWIGELGGRKDAAEYGVARRSLAEVSTPAEEQKLKDSRGYRSVDVASLTGGAPLDAHEHFGLVIASCEHGDVRPMADGVMIYGDGERRFEALAPAVIPRQPVLDELYAAIVNHDPPLHSGAWGLANLEAAVAILRSSREGRTVSLVLQVPA